MTEIILGIIAGLLAHQAERITRRMPDGWQQMTNYGVGWLSVFPFFCWLFNRTPKTARPDERAKIAYILAGVFFGVGVGIGRVLDALKGKK